MFSEYFDKTVVISLAQRSERRERLLRNLEECGLKDDFEWFEAIDGSKLEAPPGWASGAGGWGCLLSHLEILRKAIADDVRSILILEDDVCFSRHTHEWLPAFMDAVPSDWHQMYLGGQHLLAPHATENPLVWIPENINRTHAYAVTKAGAVRLLRFLSSLELYTTEPGWHIDHGLGHGHFTQRWRTYCPPWWICGQDECVSDVCAGMRLSRRWWPYFRYATKLPYILTDERTQEDRMFLMLPDDPDIPEKARSAFPGANAGDAILIPWLRSHALYALAHGRLPAIPDGRGRLKLLKELWRAGVYEAGDADLPALCDYPYNGLFPHPMNSKTSHPLATFIQNTKP
jgi:hypothetical protein